jgi:hypothetical protein
LHIVHSVATPGGEAFADRRGALSVALRMPSAAASIAARVSESTSEPPAAATSRR